METPCLRVYQSSPLSDKVRMFNSQARQHEQSQALNPFSSEGSAAGLTKPTFSKEEYGRPAKGSKSEARGLKANKHVCKEMLELCEIIHESGEWLFSPDERADDPRKVISFGDLFNLYVCISNKVVGILLRARKHKLVDFEGEVLFQRQDDHVPVVLLKRIEDIRDAFHDTIYNMKDEV